MYSRRERGAPDPIFQGRICGHTVERMPPAIETPTGSRNTAAGRRRAAGKRKTGARPSTNAPLIVVALRIDAPKKTGRFPSSAKATIVIRPQSRRRSGRPRSITTALLPLLSAESSADPPEIIMTAIIRAMAPAPAESAASTGASTMALPWVLAAIPTRLKRKIRAPAIAPEIAKAWRHEQPGGRGAVGSGEIFNETARAGQTADAHDQPPTDWDAGIVDRVGNTSEQPEVPSQVRRIRHRFGEDPGRDHARSDEDGAGASTRPVFPAEERRERRGGRRHQPHQRAVPEQQNPEWADQLLIPEKTGARYRARGARARNSVCSRQDLCCHFTDLGGPGAR